MAGFCAAFMFLGCKHCRCLPCCLSREFTLRQDAGQRHVKAAHFCGHAEFGSDLFDSRQTRHQDFGDMLLQQSQSVSISCIVILK